ncbi:MAG: phosphoribosyl-ATP diphosphatase [Parvibaculum sp.]
MSGGSKDKATTADQLDALYKTIRSRTSDDPESSYTASLLARGPLKCAQKLGEEAVETVIAAASANRAEMVKESADLLYHWLVLLSSLDIDPSEVYAELARREGVSGHTEKAARKSDAES